MQNRIASGNTIINRCKEKELNMCIEKASRIMRELSNTKRINTQNSLERAHSHSIDHENSEF